MIFRNKKLIKLFLALNLTYLTSLGIILIEIPKNLAATLFLKRDIEIFNAHPTFTNISSDELANKDNINYQTAQYLTSQENSFIYFKNTKFATKIQKIEFGKTTQNTLGNEKTDFVTKENNLYHLYKFSSLEEGKPAIVSLLYNKNLEDVLTPRIQIWYSNNSEGKLDKLVLIADKTLNEEKIISVNNGEKFNNISKGGSIFFNTPLKGEYYIQVINKQPKRGGNYKLSLKRDDRNYIFDSTYWSDSVTSAYTKFKSYNNNQIFKLPGEENQVISLSLDSLQSKFNNKKDIDSLSLPKFMLINSKLEIIDEFDTNLENYRLTKMYRLKSSGDYYAVMLPAPSKTEVGVVRFSGWINP